MNASGFEDSLAGQAYLPAPGRRRALRWLVMGVVALVVLAIAGWFGFLKYHENRGFKEMSPETRAAFDAWYNKKLTIPAAMVTVEPYSDATKAAVQEFRKQWEAHQEQVTAFGNEWKPEVDANKEDVSPTRFSPATLDLLTTHVTASRPLLDAFRKVISQPDYTLNAWQLNEWYTEKSVTYLALRQTTRMLYVDALTKLPSDPAAALESANAILASAQLDRASIIVLQGISAVMAKEALNIYDLALAQTEDPVIKKNIADALSRYRPAVIEPLENQLDPLVIDHIGMLANARRNGVEIDFNNKTGREIMLITWSALFEYYQQKEESVPAEERKALAETVETTRKQLAMLESNNLGLKGRLSERLEYVNSAALYGLTKPALSRAAGNYSRIIERFDALEKRVSI